MNYVGNCYYDPEIGRFLSIDPIGFGVNWYVYALNDPSLHAAVLRYDCVDRVSLVRKWELFSERKPLLPSLLPQVAVPTVKPEHLEAFSQVAASGERIDPENAFFPMMRAIALFNKHRDAEALKSLVQASRKKR